jgi:hypothetical protein
LSLWEKKTMGANTVTDSRARMRILKHRRIGFINEARRRSNSLPLYLFKHAFHGLRSHSDSTLPPQAPEPQKKKKKKSIKGKKQKLGFQIFLFRSLSFRERNGWRGSFCHVRLCVSREAVTFLYFCFYFLF